MRKLFSNASSLKLLTRDLLNESCFVNGNWVAAESGKKFPVMNPNNGHVIGSAPDMETGDFSAAILAAQNAFPNWSQTPYKQRSTLLKKLSNFLIRDADALSRLITLETGKPIYESRAEVEYGANYLELYADEARRTRDDISTNANKKVFIERMPTGVVGFINPWNSPLSLLTKKVGAALAGGCTCVIKPSEQAPFTSLALAGLCEEVALPRGVINICTCSLENALEAAQALIISKDVDAVCFTGSTQTARSLQEIPTTEMMKVRWELSGNCPLIVFNAADIQTAALATVKAKFANSGQTSVAPNRLLVQEDILDVFIKTLICYTKSLRMGNGFLSDVDIGPLINRKQADRMDALVCDALNKGAQMLFGGSKGNYGDSFYVPTLLTSVNNKMNVWNEEIFGPIISISTFKCENEAIALANSIKAGQIAYCFTEDVNQIFRVSKKLVHGTVGVNKVAIPSPEFPFGINESGIGYRPHDGIEAFTSLKYIGIDGVY